MVHGITESAESWAPVRDRLTADYRVVSLDLRGHGRSGTSERYDLEAMAQDVIAVIAAADLERPHLVGHSLGGAVVTAAALHTAPSSVVNIDQSLQLTEFKEGLDPVRSMLENPTAFPTVIDQLFQQLRGPLDDAEFERLTALRRADQEVVLGVWDLVLNASASEIDSTVEQVLSGYAEREVPYLNLFGAAPGDNYAAWLRRFIDTSTVEVWDDHGHYPHLVAPDRFIERLTAFWSQATEG